MQHLNKTRGAASLFFTYWERSGCRHDFLTNRARQPLINPARKNTAWSPGGCVTWSTARCSLQPESGSAPAAEHPGRLSARSCTTAILPIQPVLHHSQVTNATAGRPPKLHATNRTEMFILLGIAAIFLFHRHNPAQSSSSPTFAEIIAAHSWIPIAAASPFGNITSGMVHPEPLA